MTPEARKRYAEGFRQAINQKDPLLYNLVRMHIVHFLGIIHNSSMFLPWHRYALLQYENALRRYDCRITAPYWDVRGYAGSPELSPHWNPEDGIGGNGQLNFSDPTGGNDRVGACVLDGPFRKDRFSIFKIVDGFGGCLRRWWKEQSSSISAAQVELVLRTPSTDYNEFRFQLDHGFHESGHLWVGGTMGVAGAPNGPDFWLWHGYVDMLWDKWQNQGPQFKFAWAPGPLNQTIETEFPESQETNQDYLDNLQLEGGTVKVRYEPSSDQIFNRVLEMLHETPHQNIKTLKQTQTLLLLQDMGKHIHSIQDPEYLLEKKDLTDEFSLRFGFFQADLEEASGLKFSRLEEIAEKNNLGDDFSRF